MTIWAFLSFFSFCICIILANYVYYLDKKNTLNRFFTAFCMLVAFWAFMEFMCRQVGTGEQARFWIKMLFFWPFFMPLLLVFVARLTGRKNIYKNKPILITIFLLAAIMSVVEIFISEPEKVYWGYTNKYFDGGLYDAFGIFEQVVLLSLAFWIIILLVSFIRNSKDEKRRMQVKYFLAAFLLPFCSGIFQIIVQYFVKERIPEFTAFTFCWFVGIVVYAVRKYELLTVNPYMAAENILLTMPSPLALLDSQKNIITVNTAFLDFTGFKGNEVKNRRIDEYISKSTALEGLFASPIVRNIEGSLFTSAKQEIPVIFNSNSISDNRGKVIGFVLIARDLREIKKYQEKLLQAEKMAAVGLLAGGMAHEINNPMTVILGYTQILIGKNAGDEINLKPLKTIEAHALRCRNIIADLLIFSRTSNAKPGRLNLNTAVEKTLGLIAAQQNIKNIDLERALDGRIGEILCEENQIQQVIINLCNNAIDAMPQGGKLLVSTSQEGREAVLRVADSGTGIPFEVQKRIFEPFMTTKEVGQGTGLGLSICYEIVKKLGGSITFVSEPGKGTEFTVKFPSV